ALGHPPQDVEALGLERKDRLEIVLLRTLEELERLPAVLVVILDVHLLAGLDVPDAEADDLAVVGLFLEQLPDDEAVPHSRAHQLLRAVALAGDDEQDVLVFLDGQIVGQGFEELHALLEGRLADVPLLPGAELIDDEEQTIVAAEFGDPVVEVAEAI